MNSGWRGSWIGMRRTGKGEHGKGLKPETFYFNNKKFLVLFSFQWKIYLKILSKKINIRAIPIILFRQAWLNDGLFGMGSLLLV